MYIGVRDDGEVIGLSNSKKLMEDIPNAIVSTFGMYDVKVNLKRIEDKKYIEIDTWDKHLCSFYDDGFSSSDEIVLKIDDVLAQDWEVWENE